MRYDGVSDWDDIVAGAEGLLGKKDRSDEAVDFLKEWSTWLASLINIIVDFITRASEYFK